MKEICEPPMQEIKEKMQVRREGIWAWNTWSRDSVSLTSEDSTAIQGSCWDPQTSPDFMVQNHTIWKSITKVILQQSTLFFLRKYSQKNIEI